MSKAARQSRQARLWVARMKFDVWSGRQCLGAQASHPSLGRRHSSSASGELSIDYTAATLLLGEACTTLLHRCHATQSLARSQHVSGQQCLNVLRHKPTWGASGATSLTIVQFQMQTFWT